MGNHRYVESMCHSASPLVLNVCLYQTCMCVLETVHDLPAATVDRTASFYPSMFADVHSSVRAIPESPHGTLGCMQHKYVKWICTE